MKRVLKFGPIFPKEPYHCEGKPVHMAVQRGEVYVWCEVNTDLYNRRWTVNLVLTGLEYDGHCIGTIAIDDYTYVFHLITDQKLN